MNTAHTIRGVNAKQICFTRPRSSGADDGRMYCTVPVLNSKRRVSRKGMRRDVVQSIKVRGKCSGVSESMDWVKPGNGGVRWAASLVAVVEVVVLAEVCGDGIDTEHPTVESLVEAIEKRIVRNGTGMCMRDDILVQVVLAWAAIGVGRGGGLLLGHARLPAVVLADGQQDVVAVGAEELRQELGTHLDVECLEGYGISLQEGTRYGAGIY